MEPYRDDQFVATLESLRPEPDQEFTAELDELAAEGFPRPERGGMETGWQRLVEWLRQARPGQLALAGGGMAAVAIVLATAAIAGSGGGAGSSRVDTESAASGKSLNGTLSFLNTYGGSAEESGVEASPEAESAPSAAASSEAVSPQVRSGTGPYASGAKHRNVERAAEMTLGTDPSEVGDAAGKVLETVHAYDGIVLNSSVRGGSEGQAGARFELLIPSAKLSDALASFSAIAEVRDRHESSNDITAPTVTTGELLQDSHARIESLLNQLADAETEAEQEAVEAKLHAERRRAADLKSQLTALQRRANLSRVSLRIISGEAPAAAGGGSWNAGDALHDAGHILSVAAGVVIVTAAVLAPIALLVLLALLAQRAWIRGRRERALD
ncbi:MAG TPA: DUF4349 domain-containing protein [Solirubrobacterales bacterium]|nr:DUF4349 domain-containing protein [Solirubrobacterales bacterium]